MPSLSFPIRIADKVRQADCFWATPPAHSETAILETWSNPTGSPTQMDAGELAVLAAQKWATTCKFGTVARSLAEMEMLIRKDSGVEVTAMLLAGAEWFEGGLLGVCLFHRTWANNVFLDFLAANPDSMNPSAKISGVGTGLLYHLCGIAGHLKAATLWLETTSGSAPYYRQIFRLPEMADVVAVSRDHQEILCAGLREKWRILGAT